MSGNKVGDDLKNMAQEVADLGAGYMRMGRRWLEIQRDQVADAADAYDTESGRETGSGGPGEGIGRRGGRGSRAHGRGAGHSSTSRSDYGSPDSQAFGRANYRGIGPKNYTRSDQRITEDLCERLTRDDHVDPSDISVNVSGGVVTLGGTVRNRWMKHRVEDLAAGCEGVRNVKNNIQLPEAAESHATSSPGATQKPDADS